MREAETTQEALVFRRDNQDVAILRPLKHGHPARAPRGKPLTRNDPLWKLVGTAVAAAPTGATKKHEYLAEAFTPRHP